MELLLIAILTGCSYFMLSYQQWRLLCGQTSLPRASRQVILFFVLGFQAWLLYRGIDVDGGQNLSFLNVMSQLMWMIILIVAILSWLQPLERLLLFIAPFAGIVVILAQWFPGEHIIQAAADPKTLWHILLALITFSVLSLAALIAVLLAVQEYLLRRDPTRRLLQQIPPLESVEHSLFIVIWIGFILLTIVLISSIVVFHHAFNPDLIQKLVLTVLAWVTFAGLLMGRYLFGWRGRTAIRGTLIGVGLLMLLILLSSLGIAWISH